MDKKLFDFSDELKHQLSFSLNGFSNPLDEVYEEIRFKSYSLGPQSATAVKYYHPHQGTPLGNVIDCCVNNARLLVGFTVVSLASDMDTYEML